MNCHEAGNGLSSVGHPKHIGPGVCLLTSRIRTEKMSLHLA
jgi:hypothetical protein